MQIIEGGVTAAKGFKAVVEHLSCIKLEYSFRLIA